MHRMPCRGISPDGEPGVRNHLQHRQGGDPQPTANLTRNAPIHGTLRQAIATVEGRRGGPSPLDAQRATGKASDEILWYQEMYYEFFDPDTNESSFVLQSHGQGGWAAPDDSVSLGPDAFADYTFDWGDPWGEPETIGTHYVFDREHPDNRLTATAAEAPQDNPLKIHYKLAPATLSYQFTGDVPSNIKAPAPVPSAYSKTVKIDEPAAVDGYEFLGWKIQADPAHDDKPIALADGSITMPYWDVTLTGEWRKLETPEPEPGQGIVDIKPAQLIVYMDGKGGYDGTVNGDGAIVGSDTLPTMGYNISLPDELRDAPIEDIEFVRGGDPDNMLVWHAEKYGEGNHEVYRFVSGEGDNQRNAAVVFYDDQGNVYTESELDLNRHIGATLHTKPVDGELGEGTVRALYNGKDYAIDIEVGELLIRGVTQDALYDPLGRHESPFPKGAPHAEVPEGTLFTINESGVLVDNDANISLLFDNILDDPDHERSNALIARGNELLAQQDGAGEYAYEFKYLDLVDRDNGNAWITSSKPVTVSWPLPAGAQQAVDDGRQIHVLHYRDLHRNEDDGTNDAIADCAVEQPPVTVADGYATFQVSSFSPFALVWPVSSTPIPEQAVGSLQVTNTVTGNDADLERSFTFTVTLDDATINGTYGDMTFSNGSAKVELKHGEHAIASGLPVGMRYKVEQAADPDYTTTAKNATGAIAKDETARATFVNRRSEELIPIGPSEPIKPDESDESETITTPESEQNSDETISQSTPQHNGDKLPATGDEAAVMAAIAVAALTMGMCALAVTARIRRQ